MATPEPRRFEDTSVWIKRINREWQSREPVDLYGSITPNVVQAASGHTLVVELRVAQGLAIPTGAHITIEIPSTWDAHLGNCFRRGVRTVGNRDQIINGYGAYADVECSDPSVGLDLFASYGRILDLVDIVVRQGEIVAGERIRLTLGAPDGNLVQVQKHAQVAILPVGVDLLGDGVYRRAARHPALKVVGAHAERLRVFLPSVAAVGDEIDLHVLPVDLYSHNPATEYRGLVTLEHGPTVDVADRLDIDSDCQPLGATTTASIRAPGVYRITASDRAAGISGRSNPVRVVDGLIEKQVYFGELHSQMWVSMGTGTAAEYFEWGRDVARLDFCAPANHFGWRFEVTDEVWRQYVGTTNAFNEAGRFATLVGYEWGGSRDTGHKNVYFRGNDAAFFRWYDGQPSPEDLWDSLDGQEALTVPHHTRAFSGVDWSSRNDRHQRLVEICSKWGISEVGGPHSVQAALAMGHRLGFVGGTDSHYGLANQGSYHINDGNGLACVYASSLDRSSMWQALYDRCCYATTGDRILLDFQLDGHAMGSDVPADLGTRGPRRIAISVAGTHRIKSIEVVRCNRVVQRFEPDAEEFTGRWVDEEPLERLAYSPTFAFDSPFVFYYVRVTQANRQRAWSSPIWLTQRSQVECPVLAPIAGC